MNKDELQKMTDAFVNELRTANSGAHTSLPFIKNTIPDLSRSKKSETFQVLVIGGSFYISALVAQENGLFQILNSETGELPVFNSEDPFYSFMQRHVRKDIENVIFNFAFPIKPVFRNGKLEGELLYGTKEHVFDGLTGKNLATEIERAMEELGHPVDVSLANDTICLLLSGLLQHDWSELAAGIVGTGLNFAVFLDSKTVINLESGSFDKFNKSRELLELDAMSAEPGRYYFEKAVAGVYLYKIFNLFMKNNGHPYEELKNSIELDQIARSGSGVARKTARDIFEKSAALVAAQIAGILNFQQRSKVFVMEGSVFWKGYNFKENVKKYAGLLSPYSCEFIHIENSGVLGAAQLIPAV